MARYSLIYTDDVSSRYEIVVAEKPASLSQYDELVVYHGSLNAVCEPMFGGGKPYHDYGNGFYTTFDENLAREWAVSSSVGECGYCHSFSLSLRNLKPPLNIDSTEDLLSWMAILMKHRPGTNSRRWDLVQKQYIKKYYIDVDNYDIIIGYRANDSYLAIAKQFARGEIGVNILGKLLKLGNMGVQVCIKSEAAYNNLRRLNTSCVEYDEYYSRFIAKDTEARTRMQDLVNSGENDLSVTIEHLI